MIYSPTSVEEIVAILRQREAQPLAIRGTSPRGAGENDELVMRGVNRLVLYEPDEMIVQCEAGMLLTELAETLREKRQWIPTLDPALCQATTVGGALSEDIWQPRAERAIALRTTILGGTFVTADGRLFRSGSRVVKSVAGYDTHRSYVGAHGRFGVIAQATLRVLPLPERLARISLPIRTEVRQPSPLVGASFASGEGHYIELSGHSDDIDTELERMKATGLDFAHVNDDEWSRAVQSKRDSKAASKGDPIALELLDRLTRVFDPQAMLCS